VIGKARINESAKRVLIKPRRGVHYMLTPCRDGLRKCIPFELTPIHLVGILFGADASSEDIAEVRTEKWDKFSDETV
jgi:hypothetical protein